MNIVKRIKRSLRPKRVIIGVEHADNDEEVDLFTNFVGDCGYYSTAAVELPEDRKEKLRYVCFFSEAAEYLARQNVAVTPIDDSSLWLRFNALLQLSSLLKDPTASAEEFLSGKIRKHERRIDSTSEHVNIYQSPEQRRSIGYHYSMNRLHFYKEVEQILQQHPTIGDIALEIERCNHNRENHMWNRIDELKPSLIVVGKAHAPFLRGNLRDYVYEELHDKKKR